MSDEVAPDALSHAWKSGYAQATEEIEMKCRLIAEREMEKALEREYVTTSQYAIGPDSFRRGWRAAIEWMQRKESGE